MRFFTFIFVGTIFFLTNFTTLYAQEYRPEKISKKAVQFYEKAYEKAAAGQTKEAISLLQEATDADENYADAWLALAKLQSEQKNYSYSLICFRRAIAIDINYSKPHFLAYSISLAGTGDFVKALEMVNRFIDQQKHIC